MAVQLSTSIGDMETSHPRLSVTRSSYYKRPGTGGIHGQEFEYKMCCLMFLRGIRSGSFHLATNVNDAGAFDDVVLQLDGEDGTPKTYFIQLKHRINERVQSRLMLLAVLTRNDISLLKYFTSFRDKMLVQNRVNIADKVLGSPLEGWSLVHFTNALFEGQPDVSDLEDDILNSSESGVIFRFKKDRDADVFNLVDHILLLQQFLGGLLLRLEGTEDTSAVISSEVGKFAEHYKANHLSGQCTGCVSVYEMVNQLKIRPERQKIADLLKGISDLGDLSGYDSFIKKLLICSRQANASDLDGVIKIELEKTLGLRSEHSDVLYHGLEDSILDWWRDGQGRYLTQHSTAWQDIVSYVLRKINKPILKPISEIKIQFKTKELLNVGDVKLVLCVAKCQHSELSLLKVVEHLKKTRLRFVLGSSEDAIQFWQSRWCHWLVVDGAITPDVLNKLVNIVHDFRDKKLVVVARERDTDTIEAVRHCAIHHVEFTDEIFLNSLHQATQKEVLDIKVDCQGYNTPLANLVNDPTELEDDKQRTLLQNIKDVSSLLRSRLKLEDIGTTLVSLNEFAHRREQLLEDQEQSSGMLSELQQDEIHLITNLDKLTLDEDVIRKALNIDILTSRLSGIMQTLHRSKADEEREINIAALLITLGEVILLREQFNVDEDCNTSAMSDIVLNTQMEEERLRLKVEGMLGKTLAMKRVLNSLHNTLVEDIKLLGKVHGHLRVNAAIAILVVRMNADAAYLETQKRQQIFKETLSSDFLLRLLKGNPVRIGTELQTPVANYIPRTLRREELVRPESAMDIPERVVVVVGEPGMGKSTFLTHLALNTKLESPHTWIVKVNLNSMASYLNSIDTSTFGLKQCFEFLAAAADIKGTFDVMLFEHNLTAVGSVVVMFDGFDEIIPVYTDKIMCIIREIMRTKCARMWIMSRPYLKEDLQKYMSTKAFTMQEFSMDDQRRFLHMVWNERFPDMSKENLHTFIDKVLELMPASLNSEINFMGIPLQTMMVADVFDGTPAATDLTRLYETFLYTKCDIYFTHKKGDDTKNPQVIMENERILSEILELHKMAALVLLLSPAQLATLHDKTVRERATEFFADLYQRWASVGIINSVVDEKPKFLHRTIAEFLVSKWLTENYGNNRDFVENVLFTDPFIFVRKMFDRLLCRELYLHSAFLNDARAFKVESASVNACDSGGRTLLHLCAAYKGNQKLLTVLLGCGADVHAVDTVLYWTPIQYASKIRNWKVVDVLLRRMESTFRLSFDTGDEVDALESACVNGYLEVMRHLAREGTDLNKSFPLHLAVRHVQPHMVQYLLTLEVDVDRVDESGTAALHLAASSEPLYLTKLLIDAGANVNVRNSRVETPLHVAVAEGHLHAAMLLVDAGGDVNATDRYLKTPLHYSVAKKNIEMSVMLIETGGNVDACDRCKRTPLHICVEIDCVDILKLLLASGCNVNALETYNRTPLHRAVQSGRLNNVVVLVDAGCKMDACDNLGFTPLDYAYRKGYRDIAYFLVKSGPRVNMCGFDPIAKKSNVSPREDWSNAEPEHIPERTPFDLVADNESVPVGNDQGRVIRGYLEDDCDCMGHVCVEGCNTNKSFRICLFDPLLRAAWYGNLDTVKHLVLAGTDVDIRDPYSKMTPLHNAADQGHRDVVAFLLSRGCDANATDHLNRKPLDLAALWRHREVMELLSTAAGGGGGGECARL